MHQMANERTGCRSLDFQFAAVWVNTKFFVLCSSWSWMDSPLGAPYCTPVYPAGCWVPWPTGHLKCSGNSQTAPHTLSLANSEPHPQPGWHSAPRARQMYTHTHTCVQTLHMCLAVLTAMGSLACSTGTNLCLSCPLYFQCSASADLREAWTCTGTWENYPKQRAKAHKLLDKVFIKITDTFNHFTSTMTAFSTNVQW